MFKGPGQFSRHDGNIFLSAENITKGKTNEINVLLPDVLQYFLGRIFHTNTRFPEIQILPLRDTLFHGTAN